MTRLSVNINKVALIRNSRGQNLPDLAKVAVDCENFGAQGITVHPRPDERHIKYDDLPILKEVVTTEFNIEGYPSEKFTKAVCAVKPHQVTLVPDPPGALTSNEGWDTIGKKELLIPIIQSFQDQGIRVSLFLNAEEDLVKAAKECGTDRIEFYTGKYALNYSDSPEKAVKMHKTAAKTAVKYDLGINAGHDLNLENLKYYRQNVANLLEVSIGHAIVCDALYYGLKSTILMYRSLLV